MSTKRGLSCDWGAAKRSRMPDAPPRLCDLKDGLDLFADKHNASKAKEKGILRNREASAKYEELEKKIFHLFKEAGEIDFPDEDWVFEVLPELEGLEADTLDALLRQAQTHAKYERAARELVAMERTRLEREHAEDVRGVRHALEAENERSERGAEMRMKELDKQATAETEELRAEAVAKIQELEETIEELEEKLEAKGREVEELEAAARDEVERLQQAGEEVERQLEEAKEETDLKREASRKLKEEIIDNDRLTVANLNRIKLLESQLEQHKAALEEAEGENAELRKELSTSVSTDEAEEELNALRELLTEREKQVMVLTRRLSDSAEFGGGGGFGGSPQALRRESFFDRLGTSMKAHMASAA